MVVDGYSFDQIAINIGFPQGSVFSATLHFVAYKRLAKTGMFGYADYNTVVKRYMSDAGVNGEQIQSLMESMITHMNLPSKVVSDWADANLIKFNASKTQARLPKGTNST